jgi:hypothetical protein
MPTPRTAHRGETSDRLGRPRNSNAQCESRGSGVGTSGRTASPLTDEDVEEGLALRSADRRRERRPSR